MYFVRKQNLTNFNSNGLNEQIYDKKVFTLNLIPDFFTRYIKGKERRGGGFEEKERI